MDAFIISYGQDTNGQNARFVRAAMLHGSDVMRSFAIGNDDPAGVVGRFQLAADKYGTLNIRSAHRVTHYFDFPGDIEWTPVNEPLIRELIHKADVIHLNNSPKPMQRLRFTKPMLLHHHGSMFRSDPDRMLGLARSYKMAQAVSTPDLMRPAPDILRWLPSAYDIDDLQQLGRRHRRKPDGRVRIVHAPTNRKLKHTELLISVVESLRKTHPVDLVIVEGRTNAETMIEKAKADIVYDQLLFGYGCNSIEAWGMGVPVIAGADPWTLNQMEAMWNGLPFAEAREKTLRDVIVRMVESADMRAEYAARGLAHVRRYHDEKPALATLVELYEEAIKRRSKPRIAGKAATFDYTGGPSLTVDGQRLDFTKGPVTVTDTEVVNRLRKMVRRRPAFGVEEIA